MGADIRSRGRRLGRFVTMLVVAACIMVVGCGGTATVETGRAFDVADFSETNARDVLELAVKNKCAETKVGISAGLASALRTVASAPAARRGDNWEFRSSEKTALVSPSGRVSGELLSDLTSQCR